MKARLTVCLAGPDAVMNPGDEVDGELAIRLIEAGFAEPIRTDDIETADLDRPIEKATTRRKAK